MFQHYVFSASLLVALAPFTQSLVAQAIPYPFSATIQPYTPLENGTEIDPHQVWNLGYYVAAPLGFTFVANGMSITEVRVGPDVILSNNSAQINWLALGYGTLSKMARLTNTKILYKTEGTQPNRIFKSEWQKVGFNALPGEVSFQIWLHEGTNSVKIHLGPQEVPDPSATFFNGVSPLIGILQDFNAVTFFAVSGQYVDGPVHEPAFTLASNFDFSVAKVPENTDTLAPVGQVYMFGTIISGVGEVSQKALPLLIFPNIATTRITFDLNGSDNTEEFLVCLTDGTGHHVMHQITRSNSLDVSALPPGLYFVNTWIKGQLASGKFVKQW